MQCRAEQRLIGVRVMRLGVGVRYGAILPLDLAAMRGVKD